MGVRKMFEIDYSVPDGNDFGTVLFFGGLTGAILAIILYAVVCLA